VPCCEKGEKLVTPGSSEKRGGAKRVISWLHFRSKNEESRGWSARGKKKR